MQRVEHGRRRLERLRVPRKRTEGGGIAAQPRRRCAPVGGCEQRGDRLLGGPRPPPRRRPEIGHSQKSIEGADGALARGPVEWRPLPAPRRLLRKKAGAAPAQRVPAGCQTDELIDDGEQLCSVLRHRDGGSVSGERAERPLGLPRLAEERVLRVNERAAHRLKIFIQDAGQVVPERRVRGGQLRRQLSHEPPCRPLPVRLGDHVEPSGIERRVLQSGGCLVPVAVRKSPDRGEQLPVILLHHSHECLDASENVPKRGIGNRIAERKGLGTQDIAVVLETLHEARYGIA